MFFYWSFLFAFILMGMGINISLVLIIAYSRTLKGILTPVMSIHPVSGYLRDSYLYWSELIIFQIISEEQAEKHSMTSVILKFLQSDIFHNNFQKCKRFKCLCISKIWNIYLVFRNFFFWQIFIAFPSLSLNSK